MDPLTALSVAGTIIQFVDFGSKLLAGSVELYQSSTGCLEIHQELELITINLKSVAIKIRRASSLPEGEVNRPLAEEDQRQEDSIHGIYDEAALIADELQRKLASLKIKGEKNRVWESLKAVVKAAWSKEEILALSKRLFRLRDALNTRTMLSLGEKLDAETVRSSARFDTLDTQTQQILQVLVDSKDNLPRETINTIAKMLCRLEAVNQDEHHKTRLMIAYQNSSFGHTPSVGDITAQIEMLDVEGKEEKRLRSTVQRTILESLKYLNMTDRYEDLVEAHPQTFDWVFRDPGQDEELPWSSFGQWLREENGIYWINGKAGSGKSTLMKHIYDDKLTKKFLLDWSCDSSGGAIPCCVATFFFWNSGTDMQKSIQGLLRSLLYQVLGRCPELIPAVFPTRWAALYAGESDLRQGIEPNSYSLGQLHDAFEKMVDQKHIPLKICFLIDGLDEFGGNTMDLCRLFVKLAGRTDTAKYCLSSRPWVEFQRGFKPYPSLKLQDLTYKDIETYINGRFKESPAFNELALQNEELASSLAEEISQRAEGVFLWVTIVVNQLLRGINNSDTIPELWDRLYGFPRELGQLYDKILSQIEHNYLHWASQAFQMMIAATELASDPFQKRPGCSRPGLSSEQDSNAVVQEEGRLQGVGAVTLMEWLFAFEYDYRVNVKDLNQLTQVYKDIDTHLTARCAGLLEVSTHGQRSGEVALRPIRWMHRTARDFMKENVAWATVLKNQGPRDFSPHFRLMRGSIMSLSLRTRSGPNALILSKPNRHYGWGANAWFYAYHANGHATSRADRTKLLNLLMRIRTKVPGTFLSTVPAWQNVQYRRRMCRIFPESDRAFLVRAAMYCLSDFVEDVLIQLDLATQKTTALTFLKLLSEKGRIASTELPFPTVQMINSLINIGQFPLIHPPPPPKDSKDGEKGNHDSTGDDLGKGDLGKDDLGEGDSGEDDSGEDDSGYDDSGDDDSGEDESREDDSGEDDSGEDDSEEDDIDEGDFDEGSFDDLKKDNLADDKLEEDYDSEEDEDIAQHIHTLYEPPKSEAENLKIYALELRPFLDNRTSIVEAFLKANVDPLSALTYVPKDFLFRKLELHEILQNKMGQGCENVIRAQQFLEEAVNEEFKQQQKELNAKRGTSKKEAMIQGMIKLYRERATKWGKRKAEDMSQDEMTTERESLGSEMKDFIGERTYLDPRKRIKREPDVEETAGQVRFVW